MGIDQVIQGLDEGTICAIFNTSRVTEKINLSCKGKKEEAVQLPLFSRKQKTGLNYIFFCSLIG
ncbi:hypothetical protein [Niallia taxi]|uniref:hypothetical protein n=1 Tax=Niallia taxi TaxID=2499688 RepID=UPI002E217E53|nr:hypothetical protein [Niallia taxi]